MSLFSASVPRDPHDTGAYAGLPYLQSLHDPYLAAAIRQQQLQNAAAAAAAAAQVEGANTQPQTRAPKVEPAPASSSAVNPVVAAVRQSARSFRLRGGAAKLLRQTRVADAEADEPVAGAATQPRAAPPEQPEPTAVVGGGAEETKGLGTVLPPIASAAATNSQLATPALNGAAATAAAAGDSTEPPSPAGVVLPALGADGAVGSAVGDTPSAATKSVTFSPADAVARLKRTRRGRSSRSVTKGGAPLVTDDAEGREAARARLLAGARALERPALETLEVSAWEHTEHSKRKADDHARQLTRAMTDVLSDALRSAHAREASGVEALRNAVRDAVRHYHAHEGRIYDLTAKLQVTDRVIVQLTEQKDRLLKHQHQLQQSYRAQLKQAAAQVADLKQTQQRSQELGSELTKAAEELRDQLAFRQTAAIAMRERLAKLRAELATRDAHTTGKANAELARVDHAQRELAGLRAAAHAGRNSAVSERARLATEQSAATARHTKLLSELANERVAEQALAEEARTAQMALTATQQRTVQLKLSAAHAATVQRDTFEWKCNKRLNAIAEVVKAFRAFDSAFARILTCALCRTLIKDSAFLYRDGETYCNKCVAQDLRLPPPPSRTVADAPVPPTPTAAAANAVAQAQALAAKLNRSSLKSPLNLGAALKVEPGTGTSAASTLVPSDLLPDPPGPNDARYQPGSVRNPALDGFRSRWDLYSGVHLHDLYNSLTALRGANHHDPTAKHAVVFLDAAAASVNAQLQSPPNGAAHQPFSGGADSPQLEFASGRNSAQPGTPTGARPTQREQKAGHHSRSQSHSQRPPTSGAAAGGSEAKRPAVTVPAGPIDPAATVGGGTGTTLPLNLVDHQHFNPSRPPTAGPTTPWGVGTQTPVRLRTSGGAGGVPLPLHPQRVPFARVANSLYSGTDSGAPDGDFAFASPPSGPALRDPNVDTHTVFVVSAAAASRLPDMSPPPSSTL